MKFKRKDLKNFAFIVLLGLFLFTPIGFHTRVLVSKVLSFSPSLLDKEEQLILKDYNWELVDLNEEIFDFDDARGKVVLVNYWATWCPPCVAEMPSLQDLYEDYGTKVEFVLIARDEKEKVINFLNTKQYNFPVYFEASSSPEELSTESIPTTFVIDMHGKIVVKKIGAANWNSKEMRELLEVLINKDGI